MKVVPIKFKTLDCPKCGAKDSIRYIDRGNNANSAMDNSRDGTYAAACLYCEKEYTFEWNKDDYFIVDPALVSGSFVKEFSDHEARDISLVAAKEYKLP